MLALADYSRIFLDKSWNWLQDPEIKALTMTPDFTKEDQENFFSRLPQKTDYWIKGITYDGAPIGVMGLKFINKEKRNAEYWGYIGEKEYWGKGVGKFMMEEAMQKGRELKLDHLYLKVDAKNIRAKKLYIRAGFVLSETGDVERYTITL